MDTFALILTVLNASGGESAFVIDYGLSMADCHVLAVEWQATIDQFSAVFCSAEG